MNAVKESETNKQTSGGSLLTFVVGHVPQRRVTGVSLALTLIEAPFDPALYEDFKNNICSLKVLLFL